LEIDVGGSLDTPRLVGTANLSQVAVSYTGLPTSIRDGKGQIRFTSSQISIESFSAQTRYGSIEVNGGLFVDGLVPTRWQINVTGYGLVLEYPEGFNTIIDADVDYLKGDESELISGAIYVRSSEYNKDISVAELIIALNEPNANGAPAGASTNSDIALDLTVEAYHSLRINNNLAEVVASADFSIVGTTANPVILGSLTVDDGTLTLEGNEYEFTRGTVNFSNPRKTTPYLNLELETQVREYNIGIIMRGSIDQFQLSLRSEPPLSTASIVSLLAAGQTEEEILGVEPGSQSKSSALAAYGAGALLGKTLGTAVGGQASRLFGIDRFSIDPFISDSRSRDPGARITLGKQITKDFNVTYISSLANSFQEQTVVIQYRLTDWVTAVGTSQTDGTVAVDFKFRKRF
jgi:translocation and assembly module TamB